ncbi:MAG: tryptophan 7-halogenase, partial [Armatimonadetes bacterium]|nr:tryptophan 7-halogenase [Armatimonadota bacterium]
RVRDGRVEALVFADGGEVRAKYYIDASGSSAIMRRALGVHVDQPGNLQNISFWDYWQNAEWAVEIGVGGTRVQVMSISWGWLWFIPLGPTTTSVGLVCPADYCKKTGKKPVELYRQAISEQPEIKALLQNATCDNNFQTTKDWSYVAEKVVGENWFIIGEAAGFADPILAAGLTLAHSSAREAAYTIVALEKGELDADWLRESYEELQLKRVRQHIQFADYWYTANGAFSDLKELTRNIAKDAGLDLDAEAAFQWLGSGGFVDHGFGLAGVATFTLLSVKAIIDRFAPEKGELLLMKNNVYKLNLAGAKTVQVPLYVDGEVRAIPCYRRGPKAIALTRQNKRIIHTLRVESKISQIDKVFRQLANQAGVKGRDVEYVSLLEGLEALARDGFVKASYNKKKPLVDYQFLEQDGNIRTNFDNKKIAPAS